MTKFIAPILISSLLLVGCSNSDKPNSTAEIVSQPTFDLTVARKEIEEANRNFMDFLSKGDSVGLANCYSDDAKFMGPNSPEIEGRKNIQTVVAGIINSGATKLDLKIKDLWGTEALLAEEGQLRLSTKEGKQLDKGKYIVLWKKEDGKWKLFRDCFNSDLPAPMSK